MFAQEPVRETQSRYQLFFSTPCRHFLQKHLAYINHFLTPSYAGVQTQNQLRAYFHLRRKRFTTTGIVLLSSNKPALRRQLQSSFCCCSSTRAGIQDHLFRLAELWKWGPLSSPSTSFRVIIESSFPTRQSAHWSFIPAEGDAEYVLSRLSAIDGL